ncbi:centromere protein P-like isoform X2 [Actinia tenebrosa]|uniref:Centromere protein P-like isoform X2 n=1 Tax=Actinia tenebrosa TaxID=6105 RepID=A0A6P8IEK3_ACTTE|nr:centromere protein P-like isoform X2 [Actinia tenebrosa]
MPKRKRKENPDLKATCLKEIEELSKEINCLENDLEIKERHVAEVFADESLAGIINSLRVGHRNPRKKSNEEQELNLLLSKLEKLESLTGIIFDENKAELISSTDDYINNNIKIARTAKRWRRILSGKCFSLPFLIQFETEEIPEEEEPANVKKVEDHEDITVRVTKLSFEVNCPLAAKELNRFIATAEQEKAIGTTFIALEQYAKWYDCRKKTFVHFKSKYPDLVCIFDGPNRSDTMEIRNRVHIGLYFIIHWTIIIQKDGNVLPQIDAFVACPSKVCGSEIMPVLNSTPEQFRKMLSRFGIEQAIECIIMIAQQ